MRADLPKKEKPKQILNCLADKDGVTSKMILKNKKTLKQRLADGEILFGTFFKFNAPQLAEMLGYAGMDFIIVDGEHGDCSYSEMANVVRAANSVGMDAIVRVPNALDQNILHAGDMGAQGIQVPNLHTVEEAAEAVRKMRYAPDGNRGFAMTTRAGQYTFCPKDEFLKYSNEELLSIIMVENTEMAAQVPELCKNPNIDVLFIGTGDMSQSLGVLGQPQHEKVQAVVEQIVRDAKAGGKYVGVIAGNLEEAQHYVNLGIQYIAYGAEINMIASKFHEVVADLNALRQSKS